MKFAVRFYSQTGNTKKIAEAIASELGVEAKSVEEPLEEKVDTLVICNSMYWAGVDGHVKTFLKNNKDNIGCLVNVSTAALAESTYDKMKKIAKAEEIKLLEREFHCRGQFVSFHKGHPDADDLSKAAEFARSLGDEVHD